MGTALVPRAKEVAPWASPSRPRPDGTEYLCVRTLVILLIASGIGTLAGLVDAVRRRLTDAAVLEAVVAGHAARYGAASPAELVADLLGGHGGVGEPT
jgi:hypothetical protein